MTDDTEAFIAFALGVGGLIVIGINFTLGVWMIIFAVLVGVQIRKG